jgi:hypothetical protein
MSILSRFFGKKQTAETLSVRDYAERYAGVVRAAHPDVTVRVEHGGTAARTRVYWNVDGLDASQFFGNWYGRYLQQPGALEQLQAQQLKEALAVQTSFDGSAVGLECILPVIKTIGWLQASLAQLDAVGVPKQSQPLSQPLAGNLLLAWVEDTPDAMSYVTSARLEKLGMDRTTLHILALKNLTHCLPKLRIEGSGGRFVARLDRNYDASMALLFTEWQGRLQITGEPILAIAARDELLVCGSDDANSIVALRSMAANIADQSAYGLSSELFTWRGGSLQAYAD